MSRRVPNKNADWLIKISLVVTYVRGQLDSKSARLISSLFPSEGKLVNKDAIIIYLQLYATNLPCLE